MNVWYEIEDGSGCIDASETRAEAMQRVADLFQQGEIACDTEVTICRCTSQPTDTIRTPRE